MKPNYQISSQTLVAVARLRELHVARAQAAELKESGRVLTKADSAETAAIQFRNGSVVNVVLPAKRISQWAALLPGGQARITIEPGFVTLSNGGSQARFLTAEPAPQNGDPIPVDAGTGHEFKLVGATANETELAEIKRTLAGVRKSAKQANELRLARENYSKAFRALRDSANRVTEARQYIATHSLRSAVKTALRVRDAVRMANAYSVTLGQLYRRGPEGISTESLTADDKVWYATAAEQFTMADRKGHNRKRQAALVKLVNLLGPDMQARLELEFPVVADKVYFQRVSEKFPNQQPTLDIYTGDLRTYSTHRRQLRQWNSVRTELTVPYKLALARLCKAEGK